MSNKLEEEIAAAQRKLGITPKDDNAQKETKRLHELMSKQEELASELERCKISGPFGVRVCHKFVNELFYSEALNAMYNERLRAKKEYAKKLLEEKNFSHYIILHERPWRFEALAEIDCDYFEEISDREFWAMFWSTWTDTENLWQNIEFVEDLLDTNLDARKFYHSWQTGDEDDEYQTYEEPIYDSLPDVFKVYRGHQGINEEGYSWSLSLHRAHWFAKRFDPAYSVVTSATCKKSDILTVLNGRHEVEVAIQPYSVFDQQEVSFDPPAGLEKVFELAKAEFKLGYLHGPIHWLSVLRNVEAICDAYAEPDRQVCRLFALLHDCKRESDSDDPGHGQRAAEWLKHIRQALELDAAQLLLLDEAIRHHTDGKTSDNPTVGACWDADRLDLSRDGKLPGNEYLSTPVAAKLRWTI